MNTFLLAQIRCPITEVKLKYEPENERVVTINGRYAYPVINGIPMLIEEQAIDLKTL